MTVFTYYEILRTLVICCKYGNFCYIIIKYGKGKIIVIKFNTNLKYKGVIHPEKFRVY